MASSPLALPTPSRRPALVRIALVTAGAAIAVALAGVAATPPAARADAQPTLKVALKSGGSTDTQTSYTVTASGFPAGSPFTETLGDGSAIPPATGTVNASGGFTLYWTLDASSKYCATITATSGTASASASFWVAPVSDTDTGTACQGASGPGNGSPTPNASPSPSPSAATTPSASASPAAPLATTTPDTSGGSSSAGRLQSLLAAIPWRVIGIGGAAFVLLIIVIAVVSALGKQRPTSAGRSSVRRAGMGGLGGYAAGPGASSARQRVARWQTPPGSAQRYVPYRAAETHRWPDEAGPGPRGDAPGRQRRHDDHGDFAARRPAPDQRWTRSQPGDRGERAGTSARNPAARRNAGWEPWMGRR